MVLSLIRHVSANGGGDGESSPATAAVLALNELALNEWDAMVQQSAFVVSILEYLDYMPLPQVKRVMELLARIGYGYSVEDQTKSRSAPHSTNIRPPHLCALVVALGCRNEKKSHRLQAKQSTTSCFVAMSYLNRHCYLRQSNSILSYLVLPGFA